MLRQVNTPGVPSLSKRGQKEFNETRDYWWGQHTNCISFNKEGSKRCFGYRVLTDAVSTSVLFNHRLSPSEVYIGAAAKQLKHRKRKKPAPQTPTKWVKGWSQSDSTLGKPVVFWLTLAEKLCLQLLCTASRQPTEAQLPSGLFLPT